MDHRCIVEIEQALEENKLSRESIDDDLYEPEEVRFFLKKIVVDNSSLPFLFTFII